MKREEFEHSPAGRLVPTILESWAFVPHPLPPKLDMAAIVGPLTRAAQMLGELNGVGRMLPNPYLLIRPFSRREAVASSSLEGTITTLPDLFQYEAGAKARTLRSETREVHNYVRAMEHANRRLKELPVSLRLIREIHEILMDHVHWTRGSRMPAGEFRREQNWIGSEPGPIARFVPPPPAEMLPALNALERYIRTPPNPELPFLVRLALVHYQFETIHPFSDGNGRVGRLLIPLMLHEEGSLAQPLLYLSAFFERHRDQYIDRLYRVSRDGAWVEWIGFFLKGIEEQSRDGVIRARRLLDLRSTYRERLQQARASALLPRIIDLVFESPVLHVPMVAKELGITYRSAQQNVQKLVTAGILRDLGEGLRPRMFIAEEVIDAVRRPLEGLN
jgi:Fic family protein